jgi:hypothetical protein
MNKKSIWITTVIIGILLFGYITYNSFFHNNNTNAGENQTQSVNNFHLSYTYQGNNEWAYSVIGTLPTPCYAVNTEALVAESYPEQVTIMVTVQEQPTDGVCSTVIQDYSHAGRFQASAQAKVSFVVR